MINLQLTPKQLQILYWRLTISSWEVAEHVNHVSAEYYPIWEGDEDWATYKKVIVLMDTYEVVQDFDPSTRLGTLNDRWTVALRKSGLYIGCKRFTPDDVNNHIESIKKHGLKKVIRQHSCVPLEKNIRAQYNKIIKELRKREFI